MKFTLLVLASAVAVFAQQGTISIDDPSVTSSLCPDNLDCSAVPTGVTPTGMIPTTAMVPDTPISTGAGMDHGHSDGDMDHDHDDSDTEGDDDSSTSTSGTAGGAAATETPGVAPSMISGLSLAMFLGAFGIFAAL